MGKMKRKLAQVALMRQDESGIITVFASEAGVGGNAEHLVPQERSKD